MYLALVIDKCEELMICDLAETYHLFNYKEYPPLLVGTLVFGLKDDSRTKLFLSDQKQSLDRILFARMVDELSFLSWANSKDGQKNRNRPKSVLQTLLGIEKKEEYATFDTYEEFQQMWNAI